MEYLVVFSAGIFGALTGWVVGKVVDDKIRGGCPVRSLAFRTALFFLFGWFGFSWLGKFGVIFLNLSAVSVVFSGLFHRTFERAFRPEEKFSGYAFFGWVAFWSACITSCVATQVFAVWGFSWALIVAIVGGLPLAFVSYGVSRLVVMLFTVAAECFLPALAKQLTAIGAFLSGLLPCGKRIVRRR
jgi:hypothetical protein